MTSKAIIVLKLGDLLCPCATGSLDQNGPFDHHLDKLPVFGDPPAAICRYPSDNKLDSTYGQ